MHTAIYITSTLFTLLIESGRFACVSQWVNVPSNYPRIIAMRIEGKKKQRCVVRHRALSQDVPCATSSALSRFRSEAETRKNGCDARARGQRVHHGNGGAGREQEG